MDLEMYIQPLEVIRWELNKDNASHKIDFSNFKITLKLLSSGETNIKSGISIEMRTRILTDKGTYLDYSAKVDTTPLVDFSLVDFRSCTEFGKINNYSI